jgi:hypothetical protein
MVKICDFLKKQKQSEHGKEGAMLLLKYTFPVVVCLRKSKGYNAFGSFFKKKFYKDKMKQQLYVTSDMFQMFESCTYALPWVLVSTLYLPTCV